MLNFLSQLQIIRILSFLLLFNNIYCLNLPLIRKSGSYISNLIFQPSIVQTEIIKLINNADESIMVSLYGFENKKIADALIDAKVERGINIRMSTEYDSESSDSWQKIINSGISVRLGNFSGIMHNKYLIFDDTYLVTGSTNLTRGMFRHFNNTIILKSKQLINDYKDDFEIQYAGYYANEKDDGYDTVIGGGSNIDWSPQSEKLESLIITPFFTPYKRTITNYTDRSTLNSKECPVNSEDIELKKTCFRKISSNLCEIVHSHDSCTLKIKDNNILFTNNGADIDLDCYNKKTGSDTQGTTYRFLDHDKINPDDYDKPKEQQRPAELCVTYNHAINTIIKTLRTAQKSITFLVFAFTDRVIMQELIRAKKRNIEVKIWMDSGQYQLHRRYAEKSLINLARQIGNFKLTRRSNAGLLHHKVIIVDDQTIILGSMNYSSNAVNNNDENFLLIKNANNLARSFKKEIIKIDRVSVNLLDQKNLKNIVNDGVTGQATNEVR